MAEKWNVLDFEKPIETLEEQISQIKRLAAERGEDRAAEIAELENDRNRLIATVFSNLTPWDVVLIARHPKRPYTLDYVNMMMTDVVMLHGDRLCADDKAMVGGLGKIGGKEVMFMGQQKGRDLKERSLRNFGSAKPEGYRKAMRLMRLAAKFNRPVICFVDTPAADCSVGAEQRGISEAIAHNLMDMSVLKTPIISVVIGEGGSGGALGIAVADRVMMLKNSIYSVIPPEGAAAILMKDPTRAKEMAETLKITGADALKMGIVDEVIDEPLGAAHRYPEATAQNLKDALLKALEELESAPMDKLLKDRYEKFRRIGVYNE